MGRSRDSLSAGLGREDVRIVPCLVTRSTTQRQTLPKHHVRCRVVPSCRRASRSDPVSFVLDLAIAARIVPPTSTTGAAIRTSVETIANSGISRTATLGRSGASNKLAGLVGSPSVTGTRVEPLGWFGILIAIEITAQRTQGTIQRARDCSVSLTRPHHRTMPTTTEKDYARLLAKATCPRCASTQARRTGATPASVNLRCAECGEEWGIAERRKPRSSTVLDQHHAG